MTNCRTIFMKTESSFFVKLLATKLPNRLDEFRLNELISLVSLQRKSRASKFKFIEDIYQSLTGEILLRYGLQNKIGFNPDHLHFSYNSYGKPVLSGIENIDFSISHSGNWVIVGLSERAIGVDTERIHNVDTGIADLYFSEEECKIVKSCSDRRTLMETFYRIWTLKEAYIKAIGKGLSCPLSTFTVIPGVSGVSLKLSDQVLPRMFLKEYDLDPEYKCAVCCEIDSLPAEISIIKFETLVAEVKTY